MSSSSVLTQWLPVATTGVVAEVAATEYLDEAEAVRVAATWSSRRGSNRAAEVLTRADPSMGS